LRSPSPDPKRSAKKSKYAIQVQQMPSLREVHRCVQANWLERPEGANRKPRGILPIMHATLQHGTEVLEEYGWR
jgi:hypothetical protein